MIEYSGSGLFSLQGVTIRYAGEVGGNGLAAATDPERETNPADGSTVRLWIGVAPGEACDF